MKSISYKLKKANAIILLLLLGFLASGAIGCGNINWPHIGRKRTGFQVVPLSSRDVVDLNADDIVRIMRRAGFSDMQILELGTDLRNGLLLSGAAQIKVNKKVEAIFAARGDYVYITTRLRGNFIYDVKTGRFAVGTPSRRS